MHRDWVIFFFQKNYQLKNDNSNGYHFLYIIEFKYTIYKNIGSFFIF
jgi:hypothetical protein